MPECTLNVVASWQVAQWRDVLLARCGIGLKVCNLFKGQAQILVGIYGYVVHSHLVMQVRPGGAARLAHITDALAAGDMLSGNHGKR